MPTPSPSCAVAFARERNNATDAQSATSSATTSAATARKPASIQELRAQLRAQPERNQKERQERSADPELRTSQPAAEGRRQRVLAMLDENPNIRRAVVVDNADTDLVLLALAIRGQATCELAIPAAKFDPFKLLELIERYGSTLH